MAANTLQRHAVLKMLNVIIVIKHWYLVKVSRKKMADFKSRPKSVDSDKDSTFKTKYVATNSLDEPGQGLEEDVYIMYPTDHKKIKPVKVVVYINDKPVKVEVDTGGEKNLWSTPLDYSMEYFWTTFGPLLEYPIRVSF